MAASGVLYDDDFYLWTQQQAALLQAGKLDELDVPHLAAEIASLGQQDRRELRQRLGCEAADGACISKRHRRAIASRLTILLLHL